MPYLKNGGWKIMQQRSNSQKNILLAYAKPTKYDTQ